MTGLVIGNDLRSPLFPDIPTLAETGLSRGELGGSWYGLFHPARRAACDRRQAGERRSRSIMAEPGLPQIAT